MDGVGEVASLLEDYDQVLEAWSDPDADFEKLGSLQAEIEEKLRLRERGTFNAWWR